MKQKRHQDCESVGIDGTNEKLLSSDSEEENDTIESDADASFSKAVNLSDAGRECPNIVNKVLANEEIEIFIISFYLLTIHT